mmetsp:Transcript_17577/g.16800  ORF Transcript_17577/g.16800 Transcript_17577/m.16800 type:complete len:217 (-) Transcript_17577:203-853(-)
MQLQGMKAMHISLTRYLYVAMISFIMLKLNSKSMFSDLTTTARRRDLILRSFLGLVAFNLSVVVASLIPLSIMMLVTYTSGFWASIMGYFILGDVLQLNEIIAMLLGYTGIAFIIMCNGDHGPDSHNQFILGVFLAFLNSFLVGAVQVLCRKMKGIHFSVIMFNYAILGFVMMVLASGAVYLNRAEPIHYEPIQYWQLAGLTIFGAFSSIFFTAAT